MIFGYIFINRIQPFEAAKISAAFFLCRPMRKHNRCHTFQNKFQDDIWCTLVMYSYIWDLLYNLPCFPIKSFVISYSRLWCYNLIFAPLIWIVIPLYRVWSCTLICDVIISFWSVDLDSYPIISFVIPYCPL